MDPIIAAQLREPFAPEAIGKLPKIHCGACRKAAQHGKSCEQEGHVRRVCGTCKNRITSAHMHVDYVGHAHVTDRLLSVDPAWTWEPMAFDDTGLPAVRDGGLWIRLTVAGVTRIGFGDAGAKTGGDAVKEAIGDAIRNAAMRFGVALDLWRKERSGDGDAVPNTRVKEGDSDIVGLRKSIWAIARTKGLATTEDVEGDFTEWSHNNGQIQDATKAVLAEYLNHLKRREVAS